MLANYCRVHINLNKKNRQSSLLTMDPVFIIQQKVQNAVFRKRIRLSEFFRDFDPLRHGKITIPQFRRCMQMLDLYFSEIEIQQLEKFFVVDRDRFNYVKFCEEIDKGLYICYN